MGETKSERGALGADMEEALRQVVGTSGEVIPPREGCPLAVRPTARGVVPQVLAWATSRVSTVTVSGSGSHRPWEWAGGRVLLRTDALARIEDLDERSLMVHVEAGIEIAALARALADKGYDLGPAPLPGWAATLGGCLATAPPSRRTVALPSIPARVLGLDFVTAQGEKVQTKAVPRSAAGPDVKTLLFGSWGTLGAIVGATLAIRPIPPYRGLFVTRFRSGTQAAAALGEALRAGASPSLIRLASSVSAPLFLPSSMSVARGETLLAVGFDGAEGLVRAHLSVVRQASAGGREEEDTGRWDEWAEAWAGPPAPPPAERDALVGEASAPLAGAARLASAIESLGRGDLEARAAVTEASPQMAIVRFALARPAARKGRGGGGGADDGKAWNAIVEKLRGAIRTVDGGALDWVRARTREGSWRGRPPSGRLDPLVGEVRRRLDPAGILNPRLRS